MWNGIPVSTVTEEEFVAMYSDVKQTPPLFYFEPNGERKKNKTLKRNIIICLAR